MRRRAPLSLTPGYWENHTTIWSVGCLAVVLNIVSIVINLFFASSFNQISRSTVLQVLVFVAFGLELLTVAAIIYLCIRFVKGLRTQSLGWKVYTWLELGVGAFFIGSSIIEIGTTLVWLLVSQKQSHSKIFGQSSLVLVAIWTALWALATLLEITLLSILALWTWKVLRTQSAARLDLNFGIRVPSMAEIRPSTHDTFLSFQSGEITLHSPPRTPVSRGQSSTRRSSITRVEPGSSRTRLASRGSAKTSVDIPPYQLPDAMSSDSAFDNWDTSSVHREMRATIQTSSPIPRPVLETIPGSRPDSPANALDGPFPPSSPSMPSSPPHAASSDKPTAIGWDPSSPPRPSTSTAPSSPPNFSRPTSSQRNKNLSTSMIDTKFDMIHPLFRPNSPRPPPIALGGTNVTASPLAEQTITPKTLARLRSNTLPSRHKQAMLSVDSMRSRSNSGSGPGSPGPTIADDEELPPILPGFVLAAGSRSSMIGYGRRKSTRDRKNSDRPSAVEENSCVI